MKHETKKHRTSVAQRYWIDSYRLAFRSQTKGVGVSFRPNGKGEPSTELGKDIEAVHDMRLATRRMRAAFDLFGIGYKKKTVKP